MLNCIIIEDQPPAQRILQKYINDTDGINLRKGFSDAVEASSYLETNTIDLIFLDINLPGISGMEFLKVVNNDVQVILTTAFSEYALESYEYNVTDYLLKPFSFTRFSKAVEKVLSKIQGVEKQDESEKKSDDDCVYIKSGYDILKIECERILFIKSDADYTELITSSTKYLSQYTLKDWITKLNDNFCQIHRSYIINLNHLQKIAQNKAYISENHILPIGRSYKKDFKERYYTD